jgi:hypothetical protein
VACHSWLATAAATEEVHEMSADEPRWLVTCSCGWTSEFSQRWHAESVAKLHPKVGEASIAHTVTIEEPSADPPAEQQLTLI